MKFTPMKKQVEAIKFQLTTPRSGLFMRMGTGKTVSVLTALDLLMYEKARMRRALLIAPLRVAQLSWPDEIQKWDHLRHLKYSFIHGSDKRDLVPLAEQSDIVAINYEGIPWWVANKGRFPHFDMMILDESTWIKNPTGVWAKEVHRLGRFIPLIVILTGSPSPNSLMDIWSQVFVLDRGARLGENITEFRRRYFFKSQHQWGYYLRTGAKEEIVKAIADLVLVVKQEDQEGIPVVHNNIIKVQLPPHVHKHYREIERDFFTVLDSGYSIEALNAQAKTQKLRQFVSGFVYTDNGGVEKLHESRLAVLKELLVSLRGQNVLIAIQYREEVPMIQNYMAKHLKIKDIPFINSKSSSKDDVKNIRAWQAGSLPILMVHENSVGYGMNLQSGGADIIWYSLTWNLEKWEQLIARLARMGQASSKVMNHILMAIGTVDEPIYKSLVAKDKTQNSILEGLKSWRESRR